MKRFLSIALFASLAGAQPSQTTSKENMVHDRGQTPVQRQSDALTLQGMLVRCGVEPRPVLHESVGAARESGSGGSG